MRQHLEVAEAQKKAFHVWQYLIRYHSSNSDALSILSCATTALREEANLLREIERIKELQPAPIQDACL